MTLRATSLAFVLELIGKVAVEWNNLEGRLWQVAQLYLDTDKLTTELLLGPMRPSDISKLILKLAKAKERNVLIQNEISWWVGAIDKCRETRNKILHQVGNGLEVDGKLEVYLVGFCASLVEIKSYGESLFVEIQAVFYDAANRPFLDDDLSGPNELFPLRLFIPPQRPGLPKNFN
jgi:hypothetical protein